LVVTAAAGFDSHFSSVGKEYCYKLSCGVPDPLQVRPALHQQEHYRMRRMQPGCARGVGSDASLLQRCCCCWHWWLQPSSPSVTLNCIANVVHCSLLHACWVQSVYTPPRMCLRPSFACLLAPADAPALVDL
jgi:hypothetical protein